MRFFPFHNLYIFSELLSSHCDFEKNYSIMKGDDIFLEKTLFTILLSDISIKESAKNSIFVYFSKIQIDNITIENNLEIGAKGAGLIVDDVLEFELIKGTFKNLSSLEGGAMYFTQSSNDIYPYYVRNKKFWD